MGNDDRVLGDQIAIVIVVLNRPMRDAYTACRMPSKNFLHHGFNVRQPIPIFEAREPMGPDYLVYLGLGFGLNIRVHHHQKDERSQGRDSLEGTIDVRLAIFTVDKTSLTGSDPPPYIAVAANFAAYATSASAPLRSTFAAKEGTAVPAACKIR